MHNGVIFQRIPENFIEIHFPILKLPSLLFDIGNPEHSFESKFKIRGVLYNAMKYERIPESFIEYQ